MPNNNSYKNQNIKSIIGLALLVPLSFFLFLSPSLGQSSPQFLVSWQAQSYAPSWYQGKILPTNETPIEINLELIDRGKLVDLSRTKVRWYVNDKLVKNEEDGLGIKTLKFNIPDYPGWETEIRISIVNYLGGETLDKIIRIPVVSPEAIINAPYPDRQISIGSSIFQAVPFFFNTKNLNSLYAEWSANEQKPTGLSVNPWLLNLNIGPETPIGTKIKISVLVKNILKELEFASKSVQLQVK